MSLPSRSRQQQDFFCQVCRQKGFRVLFDLIQHIMVEHLKGTQVRQSDAYESYKSYKPQTDSPTEEVSEGEEEQQPAPKVPVSEESANEEEAGSENDSTQPKSGLETLLQCDFCQAVMNTAHEMTSHLYQDHRESITERIAAAKMIMAENSPIREDENGNAATQHNASAAEQKDEGEDSFQLSHCSTCNKYYPNVASYEEHVLQQHNEAGGGSERRKDMEPTGEDKEKVTCPACSRQFSTKRGMRNHYSKLHQNLLKIDPKADSSAQKSPSSVIKKTHTCPTCNKRFTSRGGLNSHIKRVHNVIKAAA